MTIASLKELLKERGLTRSGSKQELIDRLEDYGREKGLVTSSGNASTSTSSQLPPVVDIQLKTVLMKVTGRGTDDEGQETVKEIIDLCFSEGVEVLLVDFTTLSTLTSIYYNPENDSSVKGSLYLIYGFSSIKHERPEHSVIQGTGNEGSEFALQYTNGMLYITLPQNEDPAKRQRTSSDI